MSLIYRPILVYFHNLSSHSIFIRKDFASHIISPCLGKFSPRVNDNG